MSCVCKFVQVYKLAESWRATGEGQAGGKMHDKLEEDWKT